MLKLFQAGCTHSFGMMTIFSGVEPRLPHWPWVAPQDAESDTEPFSGHLRRNLCNDVTVSLGVDGAMSSDGQDMSG